MGTRYFFMLNIQDIKYNIHINHLHYWDAGHLTYSLLFEI